MMAQMSNWVALLILSPPHHMCSSVRTTRSSLMTVSIRLTFTLSHDHSTESDNDDNDTKYNADTSAHVSVPTTRTASGRVSVPVSHYGMINPDDLDSDDRRHVFSYAVTDDLSNMTYRQAMNSDTAKEWIGAMEEEMNSLNRQKVGELVFAPDNVKPIPTRWLYKVKFDDKLEPVRYKARVVVLGNLQKYGDSFTDTYAPVAKAKSMKMMLSIAAKFGHTINQIDFETAFLNAPLKEKVHVKLPDGYKDKQGRVWLLHKALYGLRQAPHAWNGEVDSYIQSIGWTPNKTDPCIYTKRGKHVLILVLYVDDTLICFHPDDKSIWDIDKAQISTKYRIKDLGLADWILNMKVSFHADGHITLSQQSYVDKLLLTFDMTQCKPVANAASSSDIARPTSDDDIALTPTTHALYRSLIGGLLYASNMTRVDITYAVGMLCRHVAAPCQRHLTGARHVLKYLAGTKSHCLMFGVHTGVAIDHDHSITAYADASFANEPGRFSTSGTS